jgi:hypothetical protein
MSGKDMAQVAAKHLPRPGGKSSTPPARPHSDALADLGIVPSWDSYDILRDLKFGSLVEKRTQIKEEMDFRKQRLEEIDKEIQAYMTVAGTEKVTWDNRPVTIVHSRSGSKIVAEKLLMAGVAAQTIADATEEGKPYEYILVGKPSNKSK